MRILDWRRKWEGREESSSFQAEMAFNDQILGDKFYLANWDNLKSYLD